MFPFKRALTRDSCKQRRGTKCTHNKSPLVLSPQTHKKDMTVNDLISSVLLRTSTQQNVLNQLFDWGDWKDGNNEIGSLCESVIYVELFYYLYHKSSAVIWSNGDQLHDASQVGNTTTMHILHCIKKYGVSISVHMTICYKTNGGIKINMERIDLNLRLFNCPRICDMKSLNDYWIIQSSVASTL